MTTHRTLATRSQLDAARLSYLNRRRNTLATFSIGLVLVLGAVWYYFYARAASEQLAERDFRQLNQLAAHTNAILANFPYLFQFSLLQESYHHNDGESDKQDCAAPAAPDPEAENTAVAQTSDRDLLTFLRCRTQTLQQTNGDTFKEFAAATSDASEVVETMRDAQARREAEYFRRLRSTDVLRNLRLTALPASDRSCDFDAAGERFDQVGYRLDGTPGNQTLSVVDCRSIGYGADDVRNRLIGKLPFSDLFPASVMHVDFDQVGVVDSSGNVLFLTSSRIDRGNRQVGQMIDTSSFARIAKMKLEEKSAKSGEDTDAIVVSSYFFEHPVGGIDYKLFVQPLVPNLPPLKARTGEVDATGRWFIIGLKQTSRFNDERFPLPSFQFGMFLLALILTVTLLPGVRLLFLGSGASLSRFDFSVLVGSLMIATGTAVILALFTYTHIRTDEAEGERIKAIAADIKNRFTSEIREKYRGLEAVETLLSKEFSPLLNQKGGDIAAEIKKLRGSNGLIRWLHVHQPVSGEVDVGGKANAQSIKALRFWADPESLYPRLVRALEARPGFVANLGAVIKLHQTANRLYQRVKDIPLETYEAHCWNPELLPDADDLPGSAITPKNFDLAWMMDNRGRQIGSTVRFRDSPVRFISVPGRHYFQAAAKRNAWAPPWLNDGESSNGSGVVVERIFSHIEGQRITVISRPYTLRKGADAKDLANCEPAVTAVATRLFSVVDPALPPGVGFAIINDSEGRVLYHSNDDVTLIENFYAETDNNKALLAATQIDQADYIDIVYGGRPMRAYVTPIEQVPWSLVVFKDRELDASITLTSALYALGLITLVASILLIAMWGAQWLGAPLSRVWWPAPGNVHSHGVVVFVCAAYIAGLIAALDGSSPNFASSTLVLLAEGLSDLLAPLLGFGFAHLFKPPGSFLAVLAAIIIGPYIIGILALLWRGERVRRHALTLALPPVALLWLCFMSNATLLKCSLAGAAALALTLWVCGLDKALLRNNFRLVHACAGVVFFIAVTGLPAIVFYTDSFSYHLLQKADHQKAWERAENRSRLASIRRYAGSLRLQPGGNDWARVGQYRHGDYERNNASGNGEDALIALKRDNYFAHRIAQLIDWIYLPRAAETAVIRPRSGADPGQATANSAQLQFAGTIVHPRVVGVILILVAIFLYIVARVASRRLFGLHGNAREYVTPWPSLPGPRRSRPPIDELERKALIFGYTPSPADCNYWAARGCTVLPIERIGQISLTGGRTLSVLATGASVASTPALTVGDATNANTGADGQANPPLAPQAPADLELEPGVHTIILTGLEVALREIDPERSRAFRRQMRFLLDQKSLRLVVCSELLPSYWLSHAGDEERAEIAGGIRGQRMWLELLDRVRWYAPHLPNSSSAKVAPQVDGGNAGLACLDAELNAFAELSHLRDELKDRAGTMRASQVLPIVFHAAHSVYARKWHACTLKEQALLLQIARKELINPEEYEAIGSLEMRGLIRRDPRVRMANKTLMWFVENASISTELADYSAAYERNLWQSMRWPLMMVLLLVALFLFQHGVDKLEWVIGASGAFLTLATTIVQVWNQMRTPRPAGNGKAG